jgi:hypothetical protein
MKRIRYATHSAWAGGGRATSDVRRKFWAMAARTNSSWAPRGPRSRSRPSFRVRFKCAKPLPRESAHYGRVRTPNDPGWRPRCRACKTSDRRGHLATDQPLRTDCKDIPYDQHPDHQFRIDRRTPHGRIARCKFAAKPEQIESSVDLPRQVIFRDSIAKTKFVEQLTLVTLQTAHHGTTSPRFASPQRNHGSQPVSTNFCNKICQQRTTGLPHSRMRAIRKGHDGDNLSIALLPGVGK